MVGEILGGVGLKDIPEDPWAEEPTRGVNDISVTFVSGKCVPEEDTALCGEANDSFDDRGVMW